MRVKVDKRRTVHKENSNSGRIIENKYIEYEIILIKNKKGSKLILEP